MCDGVSSCGGNGVWRAEFRMWGIGGSVQWCELEDWGLGSVVCLQDPKIHHNLDRRSVKEVQCGVCSTQQPVGLNCVQCGVRFGEYTCLKCNLYDNDLKKNQFHCDECGMCRVGGRENYFHCQTCDCCLSIRMKVGNF